MTVAMVYDGLRLLSPNYFYLTTALICAGVSASIGSSWTVVGTISIGLIGIALNLELDPAITAAAVISGAYFGDAASPPSDSANLAAAVAGIASYDLAADCRLGIRRRRRENRHLGAPHHVGDRRGEVHCGARRRLGIGRARHQRRHCGPILRSCWRNVCSRQLLRNAGLRRSFCPGRSVRPELHIGAHPPEQLRGYMAATLGVATLSDLPYAVFNFASPVLAIAMAAARWRIARGETGRQRRNSG